MGEWEPLADRIPVDVRRLATQLRQMKDRSGLTVPALAARTAQSAEAWSGYLAGEKVPPLAAVEVLVQASGADYARAAALWKLARKPSSRGASKPLPSPDPLDPLTPEEGLPARRGRLAAVAALSILGAAALLTVILTAVPGTGTTPPPGAAPKPPPTSATSPTHSRPERLTPQRLDDVNPDAPASLFRPATVPPDLAGDAPTPQRLDPTPRRAPTPGANHHAGPPDHPHPAPEPNPDVHPGLPHSPGPRRLPGLDDRFQGVSDRRRSVSAGRAGRCGRCARSRWSARGCAA